MRGCLACRSAASRGTAPGGGLATCYASSSCSMSPRTRTRAALAASLAAFSAALAFLRASRSASCRHTPADAAQWMRRCRMWHAQPCQQQQRRRRQQQDPAGCWQQGANREHCAVHCRIGSSPAQTAVQRLTAKAKPHAAVLRKSERRCSPVRRPKYIHNIGAAALSHDRTSSSADFAGRSPNLSCCSTCAAASSAMVCDRLTITIRGQGGNDTGHGLHAAAAAASCPTLCLAHITLRARSHCCCLLKKEVMGSSLLRRRGWAAARSWLPLAPPRLPHLPLLPQLVAFAPARSRVFWASCGVHGAWNHNAPYSSLSEQGQPVVQNW